MLALVLSGHAEGGGGEVATVDLGDILPRSFLQIDPCY